MMLMHFIASAQGSCSLKFSGKIAGENREGLAGASIRIFPDTILAVADDNGNFNFDKLCAGTYSVTVEFIGYDTKTFNVVLDQDKEITFQLQSSTTQLDEVVVEDKLMNVEHAQNFSVLTEKQLSETAGKSLGESLREIPGVNTIQAGPGIFKPVIHGVHSQRILILNYGIRQEGQQWGAEHAPEIDPFIASNIIVIKDASAIKYGTDALGGVVVVNPAPLPEKNELGGSLSTIVQSNGRSGTVSGMIEGGIKNHDGWGWRVQGTGKRVGDFHTPDYQLTNTGVSELNYSLATGYHKERYGAEVFFSHFETELGILKGTATETLEDLRNAMEREPPSYTSGFSYNINEPRQDVSHNLLKVNGHVDTEHSKWRLQYGFQNNIRKEFDFRIGSLSKVPAIDLRLNTHTLEAEWETGQSDRQTTCIGVSGILQKNDNMPGTKVIPFVPNFASQSAGLFAITRLLLSNWTVDVGARYDYRHYNVSGRDFKNSLYKSDIGFQNVSATAGASVKLKKNQTLNLNISSAWRPPHVAELYSFGTHQSAAAIEYGLLLSDSSEVRDIRDVNFKNEQALKFVTTYGKQWKRLQFEVSVYANYIFNYIYLKPGGITRDLRGVFPYFRYTQTDALFLGADLFGSFSLNSHIKAISKVSLLRASDERNHDYLVFIPSNRYEVSFRYEEPLKFLLKDFYVEPKVKYIAMQNRAPRVISPGEIIEAYSRDENIFADDPSNFDFMAPPDGYFLLNLSCGFSIHSEKSRYNISLSADNLLNTSYREYTNRFRYYADDLGRNFLFSVKYIF